MRPMVEKRCWQKERDDLDESLDASRKSCTGCSSLDFVRTAYLDPIKVKCSPLPEGDPDFHSHLLTLGSMELDDDS